MSALRINPVGATLRCVVMSPVTATNFALINRPPEARETIAKQAMTDIVNAKPASEPAATTTTRISIRHLNFYYEDGNQALRDVTAPIYDKCVTAFMGPSGCGKSTLLRVLNRMHDLYPGQRANGEILFDGEDILGDIDVYQLRSRIGMVFQKPTPFPMTIYDNIAFAIRLQREVGKSEMDDLVEAALRRAALWDEVKDVLLRNGFDLSGGQQQRLSIARAIAARPEVLLLDEPCSAIDPVSSARSSTRSTSSRRIMRSSSSPTICSRRRASPTSPASCISASSSSSDRSGISSSARSNDRPSASSPAGSAERNTVRSYCS